MCGIFAYSGNGNATQITFKGLQQLEYRGYDSWGIVSLNSNALKVEKHTGKIETAKTTLPQSHIALGHTRWATHGGVMTENAHPHFDCHEQIAVVHNGIIENYEELKKELRSKGHFFKSDTDTEVAAHLIEENQKEKSFEEAVRAAFLKLHGLNALATLSSQGDIVAFKKGSPLVAGVGKNGSLYLSSDIPTLLNHTSQVFIIEEGEGVILKNGFMRSVNAKSGAVSSPKLETISMAHESISKSGYPHYLIKEINEQPETLLRIATNHKADILETAAMIKEAFGTYFTACGTASHAGLAATYMFSKLAHRHVNSVVGNEFPYFKHFLTEKSLLIAASQSGETMDTLEAVRSAKSYKAKILSLVNVPGSTLSRLSDKALYLQAGPERAVISTKAYIAKLATFLLLAYTIKGEYDKGLVLLEKTAKLLKESLSGKMESDVKKLARKLVDSPHIYLIGRGFNYATALEGALKIKEASYIHAEGFAGGELKHGVIALIEKNTPCIVITANDEAKSDVLSNAMELKARGAYIIGIGPQKESVFDYHLQVTGPSNSSPILNILPLQLLAYHLTLLKGYDPDKPRNLAKSVTVK